MIEAPIMRQPFATPRDYEACRRLHRRHGATYYFASMRFPRRLRKRVHAIYGFVRVADEWVDNPNGLTVREQWIKLQHFRKEFLLGLEGVRPESEVLRAFCDVSREVDLPVEEAELFLDAMEDDLGADRYETYSELRDYMRGSAVAVGLMLCRALEVPTTDAIVRSATALGEAMQLTNFLRDVREDLARGRCYLPREELESFDIPPDDLPSMNRTDCWRRFMQFQIERTRAMYRIADEGIPLLPKHVRRPVLLARVLYSRILDRIEKSDYDVFSKRAQTSRFEKFVCAATTMMPLR